MPWLSKWHYTVAHGLFSYMHRHMGRGHTRHFAFNEDSAEHTRSPAIALRSLIADADASDDKNDICEHLLLKLKLALERNIDFVFCLRGPIRANRFTQPDQSENNNGVAVFLTSDGSVAPLCPLALHNSKHPDLRDILALSCVDP